MPQTKKNLLPLFIISAATVGLAAFLYFFYYSLTTPPFNQKTPKTAVIMPEKIFTITGQISQINPDSSFIMETTTPDPTENTAKTTFKVLITEQTEIDYMFIEDDTTHFFPADPSKLQAGQHVNLYTYQNLKDQSEVVAKKIEVLP